MPGEKPYGGSFGPVKNAATINVSRQMLVDLGVIRPSPVEEAERAASLAEWRRKKELRHQADVDMLSALRGKGDPTVDAVLDLHTRIGDDYPVCDGEDYSGYEADPGEWPCRTVLALAKVHGIPTREDVR